MEEFFVSVIIITRNRPGYLRECLANVFKQDYKVFEVVVVDSSDDWQSKRVVEQFPQIKYVYFKNGKNQMPESRNLGIENSKGNIVAFIDDDCMVDKDWLNEMVKGYNLEGVGGVGGGIKKDIIFLQPDSVRVGKISDEGEFFTNWGSDLKEMIEVDHLPGGNMSFKREAIQKTGWFDQNYTGTNNGEETDYCLRVRKCGYKLIFTSKACVDHYSASRGSREHTIRGVFYNKRNKVYFLLKHYNCLPVKMRRFLIREMIDCWRFSLVNGGTHSMFYFIYLMMIRLAAMCIGILAGISYKLGIINERKAIKGYSFKRRIWGYIFSKFEKVLEFKSINELYKLNRHIIEICYLASIYSQQQRFKEVEEELKKVLFLKPKNGSLMALIRYTLGSNYERCGNLLKAKAEFEEVVNLKSKISVIEKKRFVGGAHFHLGCIYSKFGEEEKARHHFKECLKIIPDHKKARENV